MPEIRTSHYGMHWEGPVCWLLQGRGAANFVGLKRENPFQPPRFACNHLVPTAAPIPDRVHWEAFLKLKDCPIINLMLPLPHQGRDQVSYIETSGDETRLLLTTLSRLSSPIHPIIKPAWTIKVQDLPRELSASNIQPLIITGLRHNNHGLITAVSDLAPSMPRRVILLGDDSVVLRPNIRRLSLEQPREVNLEDLMLLPLENIGAFILRRFARNEDIWAPMESREDRRNRLLKERNAT